MRFSLATNPGDGRMFLTQLSSCRNSCDGLSVRHAACLAGGGPENLSAMQPRRSNRQASVNKTSNRTSEERGEFEILYFASIERRNGRSLHEGGEDLLS